MRAKLKKSVLPIFMFILLPLVWFLFANLNSFSSPYSQYFGHMIGIFMFLYLVFELNRKHRMIRLLNETINEKNELTHKLEISNFKLSRLATIDALTGIGNRRYYFDLGEKAFFLAKRQNRPLCLLTLDIDNFKTINDTYGHSIGDEVLKNVAQCMSEFLRKSDVLARVGGEEFSIVLADTSIQEGRGYAEKLRAAIERKPYYLNDRPIVVTASFGITQMIQKDSSLDSLYARADKALYQAKQEGKNRVCET